MNVAPILASIQNSFINSDPNMYDVVSDGGNFEMPMFATSWLLTMFSHDIEQFSNLQRLFDVVISGGPDFINAMIK